MIQVSPYDTFNNELGVRLSYIVSDTDRKSPSSASLLSYQAYLSKSRRYPTFRLRPGKGKGNEALVAWNALPNDYKEVLTEKFGSPEKDYNPLQDHFSISAEAKAFYDNYQYDDGEYLSPKKKARLTLNASMLIAIGALKVDRENQRKLRNGSLRNIWDSLRNDSNNFHDHLKEMGLEAHTLPKSTKFIRIKYKEFLKFRFHAIMDGRDKNKNAQIVSPEMIQLWTSLYSGQRNYKPTYIEVADKYRDFLNGHLEIINTDTGEAYDHSENHFKPASESTVFGYQKLWENRVASHSKRSGDRQVFKALYEPYHDLTQPKFAGSIISIDDRQPPFKDLDGKRPWFYNGIDLGSEAFTTWVWGKSKEGIIVEFYRQMVRNYVRWGLNLPHELECEMSLNSSFRDNLLQNGAMFSEVRIEANNARGKRIEAYFKPLRYGFEKKEEGWIARPFARSESNQQGPKKVDRLPFNDIIQKALKALEKWNNTLHSNQELHPGLTRWEVFLAKQHPDLKPINWNGILPHIGYEQKSSMRAGRISLQGEARVVGFDGEVALGEKLINIMRKIEGKQVLVYWLDDGHGKVLKSLVYDMEGRQVCELLGTLGYSRAKIEQTPEDNKNRELMSAYKASVDAYIKSSVRELDNVMLIEKEKPFEGKIKFVMPGLERFEDADRVAEVLPPSDEQSEWPDAYDPSDIKTKTIDRF